MMGHGDAIGGMIVDGGNFDWSAFPERQPLLNTPDPSYHGAVWAEAAKPLEHCRPQGPGRPAFLRRSSNS